MHRKAKNLKIHETQLKFFQIMSLCYYMTCYTRCIVATISVYINNTKFYKGCHKKTIKHHKRCNNKTFRVN